MTTFIYTHGNLLESDADALVNTVNTVGIMGKGIALQFKNAFPTNYTTYVNACKRLEVTLGRMFVHDRGHHAQPRWIVNFPTKGHWRSRSRIHHIEAGLTDLRQVISEVGIPSIAIPALGCGHGGLEWTDVRPLIKEKLDDLQTKVLLYLPNGTLPAASRQGTLPGFAQDA